MNKLSKTISRFFFLAVLIALVGVYLLSQASTAYACSGYPYFGVESLPEADVLVKATVIDADDSGHNAVIRVEEYYKGEGSRFITVMRYPPALQTGALVRGYDTGCLYAGRGHRWQTGSQGYFGFKPNGDGTFTDYISGTAHFYVTDGIIYYQEGATEGYAVEFDEDKEITEEEFVDKLLEVGKRKKAVMPKEETPTLYPLMRFVNITTKNGTRYQINPDRSVTKLEKDAPIAISPDGAHVVFRSDEENVIFQYIWTDYQYTEENMQYSGLTQDSIKQYIVKGQNVSFSRDSNLVAVWDASQLTIHLISNTSDQGYGTMMQLNEIAAHKFSKGAANSLPKVTWSANGSTLAWQEANGVWRWNIFEEAKPKQIASGNNAELMDISSYGRYVRVGNWDKWRLIDTQTRKEYANTIASPNELFLIGINATEEQSGAGNSVEGCKPPLRENCQKQIGVAQGKLAGTFPFQMELLGTVTCNDVDVACVLESRSWHPAIGRTDYIGGRNYNVIITNFRAISYDVQYQRPVLLVGDYDIYFDIYADYEVKEYRQYVDILNLKGKVDSPIVSVEWGQPVFYDTYRLSSIEYQP